MDKTILQDYDFSPDNNCNLPMKLKASSKNCMRFCWHESSAEINFTFISRDAKKFGQVRRGGDDPGDTGEPGGDDGEEGGVDGVELGDDVEDEEEEEEEEQVD